MTVGVRRWSVEDVWKDMGSSTDLFRQPVGNELSMRRDETGLKQVPTPHSPKPADRMVLPDSAVHHELRRRQSRLQRAPYGYRQRLPLQMRTLSTCP